jgi:DNA-binding HxlR family transcriptional regulator
MIDKEHNMSLTDSNQPVWRRTLDIISGKWRLMIILKLGNQPRRYSDLRRMIPNVSEKVLIQELKDLIVLGVVEKKSFGEVPPRVEYALTKNGLLALPMLGHLLEIGELFLSADEKAAIN